MSEIPESHRYTLSMHGPVVHLKCLSDRQLHIVSSSPPSQCGSPSPIFDWYDYYYY